MAADVKQKIGQACASALFQSYEDQPDFLKKCYQEFGEYLQLLTHLPVVDECLKNPLLKATDKHQIIDDIFKPKTLREFLNLLIEKNLIGYISYIAKSFGQLFKDHFNIKTLHIKAEPLDAPLKKNFEIFLTHYFKGCTTEITFEEVNDIYGGFIIEGDNFYWDNSLKGKLDSLKIKIG